MSRDSTHVLQEFVRGRVEPDRLLELGLEFEFNEGEVRSESPLGQAPVYEATFADVATGLMELSGKPDRLQAWGRVILAGVGVELHPDFELREDGDVLLNGIWDAAFEEQVRPQVVAVARRIAGD